MSLLTVHPEGGFSVLVLTACWIFGTIWRVGVRGRLRMSFMVAILSAGRSMKGTAAYSKGSLRGESGKKKGYYYRME